MVDIGKRGQEGLTLTTLLLIVVGVVVAVVIILGATGILGNIFDSGEKVSPSSLQAAVEGCKISAQAGLVADFCFDLKEVGDDDYVTCTDPRVEASLQDVDTSKVNCNTEDVETQTDKAIEAFCIVNEDEVKDVSVDGDSCETLLEAMGYTITDGKAMKDAGTEGEDTDTSEGEAS